MTPFERRTNACQEQLQDHGASAAILFPSQNLYYTTGFDEEPSERHLFFLLPATGEPVFVVPDMYGEHIRDESWVTDVRTWSDDDDPLALLETVVDESSLEIGKTGDEDHLLVDDTMWAQFTQDLRKVFPAATFGLASEVLGPQRCQKDSAELDALREAATIADQAMEAIRELGSSAVGMTETELATEIETRLTAAGGTGVSFDPIVGSGPNGAKPHHGHSEREIEAGDPVVLDFGTRANGYPSDQTRTVVFDGEPSSTFVTVHELVQEALETAVETVEPGIEASEIDSAARSVIESAGYGEQFIHRTGHGVGLAVHEEPYIVAGNDRELEPGMVFSVEPGVYIPGEFGVRVEDLVVVTDDGYERLNHTNRGWACE